MNMGIEDFDSSLCSLDLWCTLLSCDPSQSIAKARRLEKLGQVGGSGTLSENRGVKWSSPAFNLKPDTSGGLLQGQSPKHVSIAFFRETSLFFRPLGEDGSKATNGRCTGSR